MVSFMDSNGDRRTVGLDDLVGPFQPCDSMILWFYAYFIKPNYFGFFFFSQLKSLFVQFLLVENLYHSSHCLCAFSSSSLILLRRGEGAVLTMKF